MCTSLSVVRMSESADGEGVHHQTAWRWFGDGQLPVPAVGTPSGTILVGVADGDSRSGQTVICARVSSHDQRADLDRQVARSTGWATTNGLCVDEVLVEVGSG